MNNVFIAIALAALPLVFFTMYSRTSEGIKLKLGSFFIIRKFKSDFLKIRSFKDIITLLLRCCFVILIILLVFDPSDVETPQRETFLHGPKSMSKENNKYPLKLIAPVQASDRFDEDRFFLESFVRNKKTGPGKISIIYNPSESMIEKTSNDIIIFPARIQAGNAFLKWIEHIDIFSLRSVDSKIKGTDIYIKNCYSIIIKNSDKVKKYAELEDGSVIAVAFEINGRRILFFGACVSSFWGDMGVSGYFIDIIDDFISNVSLSNHSEKILQRTAKSESGEVKSKLPFSLILKIASLIFIIEMTFFIFKSIRIRKTFLLILFFLITEGLFAEDFKFIELNLKEKPVNNSTTVFSIIKHELEEKTSIRISPDFCTTHSYTSFIKGSLPELPYLWITGCGNPGRLSSEFAEALSGFIQKGGIVFIDLSDGNSECNNFFNDLGLKISGNRVNILAQDHPVYKSFYLINPERLSGVDISATTKRTALIISKNNLMKRIINRDESAVKTGLNIVLYMLSGNYKSDQIHTRQILNRIKKRELYR